MLQAFRKERSEAAFAELVRRYAGLVYSTAKRRVSNATLAEDITQMVFIRFAQRPPKASTHSELAAWLHRTTVNVTIDLWRTESRRRARELQAVVMEPAVPETPLWEEIAPKLDEAIDHLNDEDRQAVLLRFFGRKTMREVGAALGVSEDAAKMRVSRAVDRLRTQLGVSTAICTAAVLGTLLAEHSMDAAPAQMIALLSRMKLPAAAGFAGAGKLTGALLRSWQAKLASGVIVLALMTVGAIRLVKALSSSPVSIGAVSPQINLPSAQSDAAGQSQFDSFRSQLPSSSTARWHAQPKMWFCVLEAGSGTPLPGARIHAAYFGVGGAGETRDVVTDGAGNAPIPAPADPTKNQRMNVFVVAAGHVPKVVSFRGDGVPEEYTMYLDPAMTASGFVVDDRGQSVKWVKILVQGPGSQPGRKENVDFQTCPVSSREDGSWSCSYVPFDFTNEIRFILEKAGYATSYPAVPVSKTGLTNLVLVINRGFTITGRVTDTEDRPLQNVRIRILTAQPGKRQSVTTGEDGSFTLNGIAGDTEFSQEPPVETNDEGYSVIRGLVGKGVAHADLAVQCEGFAPQTRTVLLSNATDVANFTLAPANTFRGRVVDEVGNPIPQAVVQTDWNDQGLRAFEWQTRTDSEGRFEWDSAPKEPILYWFEAGGYQWRRDVLLKADGSEHEIILKAGGG